ncbi:fungal-specific transcription factor domain-containing protein [Gongronella butleri]|nr:fungal-specific transcription factor domain-containing protein [Gongronella butleri]
MHSDQDQGDYIGKSGKKRERATQACTPCRKKKKRCDGAKPVCRNCVEANVECAYAACKRRGPRKGYVQLLEERLVQLEKRLSSLPQQHEAPPHVNALGHDRHDMTDIEQLQLPDHELVIHLVDLFFKYINSIFPLLHYPTLMEAIKDQSVSQPLLWSVLAIGARFSTHPAIRTDPPYWAGEKFARKAGSLINANLLEPTVPNLQFWGIMACLEYGRAAGARAWIYGGMACRICFELGLHKEETHHIPIYTKSGSMDKIAMLMRRRLFWSCVNIDKYGSAGNSRPQFFNKDEYDVGLPPDEAYMLNPTYQNVTMGGRQISMHEDSLCAYVGHYLRLMEIFGDVIKGVQRAKDNSTRPQQQHGPLWPPMDQFDELNRELQDWRAKLPPTMEFSPANVDYHVARASMGRLNYFLCGHVIWHTLKLVLHRGSLVYVDSNGEIAKNPAMDQATYRSIKHSVETCKEVVFDVMPIFERMKTYCGNNVNPYMGYSSYMFATILMTSTFTNTEANHRIGGQFLTTLFDMIELLRPHWPVCLRLSLTTRDLMIQHSKMYPYSQDKYERPHDDATAQVPHSSKDEPGSASITPASVSPHLYHDQSPTIPSTTTHNSIITATPPASSSPWEHPMAPMVPTPSQQQQQQQHQALQQQQQPGTLDLNDYSVDFNSSAFLNDANLFGQLMFDEAKLLSSLNNNTSQLIGMQPPINNDNSIFFTSSYIPSIPTQPIPTAPYGPVQQSWSQPSWQQP